MPPRPLSSREVLRTLAHEGFIFISQRGSHAKYRKSKHGETVTVIVPTRKREIPTGTVRSIIRQSHLPKEIFFDNTHGV